MRQGTGVSRASAARVWFECRGYVFCPAYASGKWYVMACKRSRQPVSARWVCVGLEDSRAHVVLRIVLQFFGGHGRSLDAGRGGRSAAGARGGRFERLAAHEEVLKILQNIFLRRSERARPGEDWGGGVSTGVGWGAFESAARTAGGC